MKRRPFKHLADRTLMRTLAGLVKNDQVSTATLLACLAEVDLRKLYVPAGYSTMYLFLVHEMHMSEDVAFKRIRAARTGRRFPAIFDAVADGRLHLSAVVLLAPHLTSENAAELLAAAEHKTKAEIELMLARRFPKPDLPTLVEAIASATLAGPLATLPVEVATQRLAPSEFRQLAPGPVATNIDSNTQPLMTALPSRATIAPLSPERFALQVTVSQAVYDKLRYVQALLGHAVPSGDVEALLERALDALTQKLERQKFARSARSRPQRGAVRAATFPPRSVARSGSAMAASARSPAPTENDAGVPRDSSLITSTRSRGAGKRRLPACGSGAGRTTSTKRSACSAPSSCRPSARRLGAGRRRRVSRRRSIRTRVRPCRAAQHDRRRETDHATHAPRESKSET